MLRQTGAGVLCFARRDGEPWLLLGRERQTPGWRQGSEKWSSFSGKVEVHESALEGAAREFFEESCASVPLTGELPNDLDDVQRALEQHACEIQQRSEAKGELLSYSTFVINVPFDSFPERFAVVRARLVELDQVFREFYKQKKQSEAVPRFFLPGFNLSPNLLVADFQVTQSEVAVTLHQDEEEIEVVFGINAQLCELLQNLQRTWRAIKSYIAASISDPIFKHPAVQVQRSHGQVISAYINKSFLEKSDLAWFPLSELLSNRQPWSANESPFRKLFLENIASIASHIL